MEDTAKVMWQYFLLGTGPAILIALLVVLFNCGQRKKRKRDRDERSVDITVGAKDLSAGETLTSGWTHNCSDSCSHHEVTCGQLEAHKYFVSINSDSEELPDHHYSEPIDQEMLVWKNYTLSIQRETNVPVEKSANSVIIANSQLTKKPLPLPPRAMKESSKYFVPINSDCADPSVPEYSEPVDQELSVMKSYTLPTRRETTVLEQQSSHPVIMTSNQLKKTPPPLPVRLVKGAKKYLVPIKSDSEDSSVLEYSKPNAIDQEMPIRQETTVPEQQSSLPVMMTSSQLMKNPTHLPPKAVNEASKYFANINSDSEDPSVPEYSESIGQEIPPLPPRRSVIPKTEDYKNSSQVSITRSKSTLSVTSECSQVIKASIPFQSTDSIQVKNPDREGIAVPKMPPGEPMTTNSQDGDRTVNNVTEDTHISISGNLEANLGGYFIPCNEEPFDKIQSCPSVRQTILENEHGLDSQGIGTPLCQSRLSILGTLLEEHLRIKPVIIDPENSE